MPGLCKRLLFAMGVSAAVATLTLAHCPAARAETPRDTFVIARNIADIITFDPAEVFEFTGDYVITNLYDRIMFFEPDNLTKLVGGAAESYAISDDGKTITLKMRQGIVFHSGNRMTAEDVAFSLRRVVKLNKTPAFGLTQFGWTPDNVDEKVKVLDAATVELTIDTGLAPSLVLRVLSAGVASVVDKALVMRHAKNGDLGYEWLRTHSAGSGAFRLTAWKPNDRVVLEAHDRYRQGAPAMKKVVIHHVPDASVQRLFLEKGDVDCVDGLTAAQIKNLSGVAGIKIQRYAQATVMYLAANQAHPILSKPKVREALRYAVDYKGLLGSVLRGTHKLHQTFWPSGMWASQDQTPYAYDLDKARALLAEAGHENGGFSISIDTLDKSPFREVARSVQASLKKLGIDSKIVPSDGAILWPKYRARKHELVLAQWGAAYADPHSNADSFALNPDNRWEAQLRGKLAWRNAWADDLATASAKAAAREIDPVRRKALYKELQTYMQSNSPYAVMFQMVGHVALRNNVDNYVRGPNGDQTFFRTVTK